jgi:tetratricopeptide (TPR) repeat protein
MRAELIERKPWTLKKIGLCFRRLGETEKALEYYLLASDMDPENIHTIIMIAHCYLDLKDYEQALKHYFRVEYTDPKNLKVLRPIAYCYFALGEFDNSEKYYDRLSVEKLSAHDLINKGHLALCKGKIKEAVEFYKQSISSDEFSFDQFTTIFNEDRELLITLGVKPDDISILSDYLSFNVS